MLKRYYQIIRPLFQASDGFLVSVCWLMAYFVRFDGTWFEATKGVAAFGPYAQLTPLVMIIWLFLFASFRVYESAFRHSWFDELIVLLKAHTFSLLVFIALSYFVTETRTSRAVMLLFSITSFCCMVLFRFFIRAFLRRLRLKGKNLRKILLIGDWKGLSAFVHFFHKMPELGLSFIGILKAQAEETPKEISFLGSIQDLKKIMSQKHVDQVVISLPVHFGHLLTDVLNDLKDFSVDITLLPALSDVLVLGCRLEMMQGIPLLQLNDSPLVGWSAFFKRCMDIGLSFLGLIFLSPFFVLIPFFIKLSSEGPVLFCQERMGLDGKTFGILKFRTMQIDAEKNGAVWAKKNDPRTTVLGAFLRKTSLDELPQLWNVLKGDMSLVGPRPERPIFVHSFKGQIPHYMLRHKVKAGITGWAQVNGWRGNTSLTHRIEADLYYIRHWSLGLDVKILWLTIWKGFIHKNAY